MADSKATESNLVKSYLGRRKQAVVLVDPYSTGCLVGQEIAKRGYLLVRLWSAGISDVMKQHTPLSCQDLEFYATITVDDLLRDDKAHTAGMEADKLLLTSEAIHKSCGKFPVVSVVCGGDRGVDFCDALSEYMGLLTNGTNISNRRDKKIQQELVRSTGLRAVRQAGGRLWSDVQEFLETESYPVVVKPIESSGSDAVKLCSTFEEAKAHFEYIMKTPMIDGGDNTGVLCQEFLRGKEYIVDHVSRDGVHKTMMVWVYDKRPANGAPFVYYGCIPVDSESPEAKILIPYARGVLDAMGCKHGASHAEVMLTADGPCLVEMNCRANGGDGIWRPLTRALTGGYTQVEAAADAYLDKTRFMLYPDKPPSPFKAAGCEIELVSYQRGTVKSTPGYIMISQLPSFVHLESVIAAGSHVEYTIDLDTCVGTVCLMHPDETVVEKDIAFIRYMEEISGLFQFEPVLENLKRPLGEAIMRPSVYETKDNHRRVFSSSGGPDSLHRFASMRRRQLSQLLNEGWNTDYDRFQQVIIMVDPTSTGCCIAQEIMKRGYSVVALWTRHFPKVLKRHIPLSCGRLKYFLNAEEGSTLDETINTLTEAIDTLEIIACIAGNDRGVDLTAALSERLELLTNGTCFRKADKKLQQEIAKKAGIRSIRQEGGSEFSDVALFLKSEKYPVVMKPAMTAGSDGVQLCHSFENAKAHFEVLKRSQAATGLDVPSILCQEFLQGIEYVVDHVSREGVHKTLMVWSMDKRAANGASRVHFGCVPEPCDSPDSLIVIPYVRAVLTALGVQNGPSHSEVIMTLDGPCFIKVSFVAHGGNGNWMTLCKALTGGFSQVEATVDAYLDEGAFATIPDVPPSPFEGAGLEILLVSYSRGEVLSTPGFEIIKQLPSFVYLETGVEKGSYVDYTVDLFSSVGSVILMNYDRLTLERDLATIREMELNDTMFEYDLEAASMLISSTSFKAVRTNLFVE